MEVLVNQVLGDKYQVQSLLGRQTGRRTFLARDLQTKQIDDGNQSGFTPESCITGITGFKCTK